MAGRRKYLYGIGAVAFALLLLIGWHWSGLRDQARLGAAYGARLTCSCRYVEGRAMGSCADDKEPGMALVTLTDRPEDKAVDASVPLMATRTARFRPGWGCLLDPVE
jgi:hypothetical protein